MTSDTSPAMPPASYEAILESISDGVFTVDLQWRITSFNRAAEEITGIDREEALGSHCADVFRSSMCEVSCPLRQTLATGEPVINRQAFFIDASGERIPVSVSTAILRDAQGRVIGGAETFRDLSHMEQLQQQLEQRYSLGDMVSRSIRMHRIFDIAPQVAQSDTTVLICGETGTGKELLARALHNLSPRCERPFIAVNCSALPDTLLESELFGHTAGAFTGARQDKPGRFARAEGGTLFLDEIGDISPALQVRLLRVLQEKTYEPLGSTTTCRADVRIITATNRDLPELIAQGLFRQDLYYRINVMQLDLPPLRERREDIPLLVDHFIARFNHTHTTRVEGISPAALACLSTHDFPGNIRELENSIERAFVLCADGDLIQPEHLPHQFAARAASPVREGGIHESVRSMEVRAIQDALERNGFNRQAAARDLGIHKSTLFRKIKTLGLRLPDKEGRHRKISP